MGRIRGMSLVHRAKSLPPRWRPTDLVAFVRPAWVLLLRRPFYDLRSGAISMRSAQSLITCATAAATSSTCLALRRRRTVRRPNVHFAPPLVRRSPPPLATHSELADKDKRPYSGKTNPSRPPINPSPVRPQQQVIFGRALG